MLMDMTPTVKPIHAVPLTAWQSLPTFMPRMKVVADATVAHASEETQQRVL